MKTTRSLLALSLLGGFLALPASTAFAEATSARAILGATPFAHDNYGTNVVKGRAELVSAGRGNSSKVIVRMSGLKPGTAHIGHIHAGNCIKLFPGTILHNLEPVVANNSGTGKSKTEIPEGLQGLADCEWWVAVHEGAENTSPQTPALAVGPVITRGHEGDGQREDTGR